MAEKKTAVKEATPKGPTNLQLAEAIRRIVTGHVNTEEQKDEILSLLVGKTPKKAEED